REDARLNAEDGGRRSAESTADSQAEPADEHGSHVGAAAAGIAAAGGLAAAGVAAVRGRGREKEAEGRHGTAPERPAEPPFEYDSGPPTAMIMPGAEIPGGLPVPEMPVPPPSGGRRAAREQAEPAPVARREQVAEPELAELQAKLDELNVPEAAYRLGGPTER